MALPGIHAYYTPGTTSKFSIPSIFNTINPISAFLPTGDDYVPAWLVKAFSRQNDPKWNFKDKGAGKAAHIISKIALGGTVFGLGALALRALMFSTDRLNFLVNKTPGQKIDKLYKRPTLALIQDNKELAALDTLQEAQLDPLQLDLEKKKELALEMQKLSALYLYSIGALPLLAAIFASGVGAKKADIFYDNLKTKSLKQQEALLLKEKQRIAILRIKKARGILEEEPEVLNLQKEASGSLATGVVAGTGALSLLVFLLGREAGKMFHDANDLDTIKFKAYKRGLLEYNKAKAFERNIDTLPLDPLLVKMLNSNLDKGKAKSAPVIQDNSLKEIMI